MKTIENSTASKPLSEHVDQSKDEIINLTFPKKQIAAIVSLRNVGKEPLSLSTNSEFMVIIEYERERIKSGKKVSLEDMKKEFLQ